MDLIRSYFYDGLAADQQYSERTYRRRTGHSIGQDACAAFGCAHRHRGGFGVFAGSDWYNCGVGVVSIQSAASDIDTIANDVCIG